MTFSERCGRSWSAPAAWPDRTHHHRDRVDVSGPRWRIERAINVHKKRRSVLGVSGSQQAFPAGDRCVRRPSSSCVDLLLWSYSGPIGSLSVELSPFERSTSTSTLLKGSATTARRPTGLSNGATRTVPPRPRCREQHQQLSRQASSARIHVPLSARSRFTLRHREAGGADALVAPLEGVAESVGVELNPGVEVGDAKRHCVDRAEERVRHEPLSRISTLGRAARDAPIGVPSIAVEADLEAPLRSPISGGGRRHFCGRQR